MAAAKPRESAASEELRELWDLVEELENVSARLRKAADAAMESLSEMTEEEGHG